MYLKLRLIVCTLLISVVVCDVDAQLLSGDYSLFFNSGWHTTFPVKKYSLDKLKSQLNHAQTKEERDSLRTVIKKHKVRNTHFDGVPDMQILRSMDARTIVSVSKFDYCFKEYKQYDPLDNTSKKISVATGKEISKNPSQTNVQPVEFQYIVKSIEKNATTISGFSCDRVLVDVINPDRKSDMMSFEFLVTYEIDLPPQIFYSWTRGIVSGSPLYIKYFNVQNPEPFHVTELVRVRKGYEKQMSHLKKRILRHGH